MADRLGILFVCLGNICRSPTAEAVFRARAARAGLLDRLRVDSCGTSDWHIGKAPDSRSIRAAATRGYDLAPLRARQLAAEDFTRFDLILAMDHANLTAIRARAPATAARAECRLFLSFHPAPPGEEVPDPYYGDEDGFHHVLDLVETASDGLIGHVGRILDARPV